MALRTGVVVMAYGTPTRPDEIEEFYTDVRHGHPPSQDQLEALTRRYEAIGGLSPLAERTRAQIRALKIELEQRTPGRFFTVYGTKHGTPRLEEAIEEVARAGCDQLIGVVLAPHYSILSVGEYIERAERRARSLGLTSAFVRRFGSDKNFVELLARRVSDALELLGDERPPTVLFSAHSLPARVDALGDHYVDEVNATAQLVGELLGLKESCTAFQSAGRTDEAWLGPELLSLLERLRRNGVKEVVCCPAGFTSDHLEVLYDLDIEAAARAAELGMSFVRTRSLNDDPAFIGLLAEKVLELAAELDFARER